MSDRKPYSRVYWSVMSHRKFEGIRDDMRHFGSWTLMLVVADMAYPVPAFVPPTVPKSSLRALVEADLIELIGKGMYRVRGLADEREARAIAATRTGPKRDPSGPQAGPKRDPDGLQDETSTRQDETRQRGRTGTQERPAPADQRRFDRMTQRRLEWFRQTGQWDPEWGERPVDGAA